MNERTERKRRSGTDGVGRSQKTRQASQGDFDPRPASFAGRIAEAKRFWAKVDRSDGPDACWSWTGATRDGYGRLRVFRNGRWTHMQAHRWAWEERHGPIPDGLYPDHTCHTDDPFCPGGEDDPHRACQNTAHMELVDDEENRRRSRERTRSKGAAA